MPVAKNILITVGIPTLGREEVLIDTIKTVLTQSYDNFELIVADQTRDHKPEFLKTMKELTAKDSRLRYHLISPPSLPAARNFILAKAKGKIMLFIDDDMRLKKDFISLHAQEHASRPEVAVIAGRIIQKGLPISKHPLYFDKYGLPQGTFNCPTSESCQTLPGGNHSVKMEIFKKVGDYHTAYRKSAIREESDLGWRIKHAGYDIYYSAEAAVEHLSVPYGGTRIQILQFDDYWFYFNDLLFALRTVKLQDLPGALFKRLRIYSGGRGWAVRFKRAVLLVVGFLAALWSNFFGRNNFIAKEVPR